MTPLQGPLKMYQGEGVRIEATRASVTAAGGPGPFLQNVVVPESLGNGIATVRLKDVDLHFLTSKDEKTIRNMHLDVTGQRVEVSEIGGCQVLGLKHGEILRHVAAKHLAPIASMTPSVIGNIARRAADGLRFFWKLGKAVALSPQWYARDTEAKGAKGKATTHASVAPSQLLDGFKQFWGCKMIIKGISSVLWYLGLKRAVAAVHLEDLHGESAFLLLKGNCKIWIAIPPRFTPKLLRCLEESGGRELVSALYEKRLLIPLCTLDNWEIPYSSATQAPGDLVITSGIHEVFNEEYNIGEAENLFSGCTFNRCIVGAKAHVEHFKWEIKQDPTLLDRNDDRRPSLVKVFLCLASEASRRGTMCQHVLDWARSLEASYANASEDYTRRGVPVLVLTVEEERFRFYPTERRDILAWENMDRISGLECRRCSEDVCLGYCELENGCQLCLECGRSEKIVAMRVASELGVLQELLEEWGPVPEDCLCRQEGLLGGEVEDTGLGNILLDDCVPPCEDYEQKPVKLADDGQLVVGGRLSPAEALAYLKKTAHRTKEEVERRGLELAKEFEGWALYAGPRQDFANVKQLALEPEAPAVGWTEMGYGDLDLPGGDGAGAAGPSFGTQDTPQIQAASSSDARAEKSGAVMCAGCGGGTRGCIIHPQVRWGGVEGHDAGGGVALASTTTGVDSLERCGVTALLSDETPPPAKRARRPHRPRAFLTLTKPMPEDAPRETEKWNALGFHPTFKADRSLWVMEWAYPRRGCVPGARRADFWEAVDVACTFLSKSLPHDFNTGPGHL